MQRLTARMRFNEGLPEHLADQMVQQFCDEHRERYLLAFVYGYPASTISCRCVPMPKST
jgi:hypothetical protein